MADLLFTHSPAAWCDFGIDVTRPIEVVLLIDVRSDPDAHDLAGFAQRLRRWRTAHEHLRGRFRDSQIHAEFFTGIRLFVALGVGVLSPVELP